MDPLGTELQTFSRQRASCRKYAGVQTPMHSCVEGVGLCIVAAYVRSCQCKQYILHKLRCVRAPTNDVCGRFPRCFGSRCSGISSKCITELLGDLYPTLVQASYKGTGTCNSPLQTVYRRPWLFMAPPSRCCIPFCNPVVFPFVCRPIELFSSLSRPLDLFSLTRRVPLLSYEGFAIGATGNVHP